MPLGGEGDQVPKRPVGRDFGRVLSSLMKLVLLCFIVGFILIFFDIQPERIFENFGEMVASIWRACVRAVEWAAPYILTGAVIVVPIWAVLTVLDLLKRRRR